MAKASNPDLSYWATLGFSIGFSALTTYLSFGIFPKDYHHPTRTIAYLSPIIGSVVYANFIAPNPSANSNTKHVYDLKQNLTHKDYYNSTILFNAELIRINLW